MDNLKTSAHRIQHTRHRLGQTTDRYGRMVYAHEVMYIVDDRHEVDEDERHLMQMPKGKR